MLKVKSGKLRPINKKSTAKWKAKCGKVESEAIIRLTEKVQQTIAIRSSDLIIDSNMFLQSTRIIHWILREPCGIGRAPRGIWWGPCGIALIRRRAVNSGNRNTFGGVRTIDGPYMDPTWTLHGP